MSDAPPPVPTPSKNASRIWSRRLPIRYWIVFSVILVYLAFSYDAPSIDSIWGEVRIRNCRQTDEVGEAMLRYSIDHGGQYPTGKTSTEIFQKLLDEHYVSDPGIFYVYGMSEKGKSRATSNTLTANNVSFDVTVPVTASSPKGLPIVFISGFKVAYEKGAGATAPINSYGQLGGMVANYKDADQHFKLSIYHFGYYEAIYQKDVYYKDGADLRRYIPHFIPQDFQPDGVQYKQLTPDGVAPL